MNFKTNSKAHYLTVALSLILSTSMTSAEVSTQTLKSPDGKFEIVFSIGKEGAAQYEVKKEGKVIIAPSGLGYTYGDGIENTKGFKFIGSSPKITLHDSNWEPVWGERSKIRNHFNRYLISFGTEPTDRMLMLEVRAYNEGIAFQYLLEGYDKEKTVLIQKEQTEFTFTENHDIWAVYSAQGKYSKVKIDKIKHSIERPAILETRENKVIAIAEAALVDYARMRLTRHKTKANTLVSNLHSEVTLKASARTPWRVIMAEDNAGKLLENNFLILNLNEPNKIKDPSWIKPGKVIREVSLSTAGGLACVDFAKKYNLQYIEYDAGWYGPERDEKSDARTVSRRGLDLQKVLKYAKKNDIGVLVYVNRRHLETQLDELLPLYKKWGIAGIKYGFVQHGSQKWTAWMHEAIRKTAEYGLLVDVHDEYRMTGWERTYPNFMTAEGIGGDETRPPNEQALANMFNRMIAGPADHTFCYYNGYVDRTTSHACQLAKMVCFFSPLQFLFWYDRPSNAKDEPELEFIQHLPVTWDETKVLHSKVGEYGTIARRKGSHWFIGTVNAVKARTLYIKLDFLKKDQKYTAHIYKDDPNVKTRTKVGITRVLVDSDSVIPAQLTNRNGMAIRITEGDSTQESVSIFDGKSLQGWFAHPQDSAEDWRIEDGILIGEGKKARLSYLVFNETKLKDFELEISYRMKGKGNTGIEVRSIKDKTGKRPFEGYHADLGHVGIGPHILGAWDFHFAKRREHPCKRGTRLIIDENENGHPSKIENAIQLSDIKKQDWNHVRIIAKGNNFKFYINGKLSSEFTDNAKEGRLTEGAIGLQIHDKGMRVEFKNIRLKKL